MELHTENLIGSNKNIQNSSNMNFPYEQSQDIDSSGSVTQLHSSSRRIPRPDAAAVAYTRNRSASAFVPSLPLSKKSEASNTAANSAQPSVHKITITPLLNLPGPRTQFRIGRDARGKWSVQEEGAFDSQSAKKSPRDRLESIGTVSEAGHAAASEKQFECSTSYNALPPPAFTPKSQMSKSPSSSKLKSVARELQVAVERLSEAPALPTAVVNSRREEQRAADDIISIGHKRRHFFCSLVYIPGSLVALVTEITAFVTTTGLYMFGMGFVCAILWLLAGLLSLRLAGVCAAALWRSRVRMWIVATAAVVFLAGVAAGFLGVLGAIGIACEANPNTRISLCGADLSSNRNTTVLNGLNTTGAYYTDTTVSLTISGVIVINIVKFVLGVVVVVTAVVQSVYLWASLIRSLQLCRKQNHEPSRELANQTGADPLSTQLQFAPESSRTRKDAVFSISRQAMESDNYGNTDTLTTFNVHDLH